MAGSVHDQMHLAALFDAGEVSRLFSASADIRAMLIVEAALAKTQGDAGVIPAESAAAIHRAAREIQIDPGSLAQETGQNGVCVPALVQAFREEMNAPEHAQFVHFGATSQDIIDTSLMLRLRQAIAIISDDLDATLQALADLAKTHADVPMAGRTYGQIAAPTSFGAVIASWGWPILEARRKLSDLQFPASLSGATGTASQLGPAPAEIRRAFAGDLKLSDPGRSWHTDRSPVLEIASALVALVTAFGKMGEDVIALCQSEVGEVQIGGAGASSTMPQKQNPVAPSVLVAIARMLHGLNATLQGAAMHRFQRDGAAWFTEWMVLPQIVLGAATAAKTARDLSMSITPNTAQMDRNLGSDGLIYAEALSFALTQKMSRPDAQMAVKDLAREVRASGTSLPDLARAKWSDLPDAVFKPDQSLGTAPGDALAFSKAVRSET